MSDNLLPLPDKIDWKRFPIIQPFERKKIAQKVPTFHNSSGPEQFAALQLYARQVWVEYLTYPAFMRIIANKYKTGIATQPSL